MADKVSETVVDALKQALAQPGEHRLFRNGKLAGLFPGRGGVHAEASTQAIRDGLLEVVRTETKGKTTIDWVRLTPRGVEFLHEHESPIRVLRELQTALQATQAGVPVWLADMRTQLQTLGDRLTQDSQGLLERLDALRQRVDQALHKLESAGPQLPDSLTALVPWALDALRYLDRRRASGANGNCPLPELFAALTEKHGSLSINAFQDGLRRLREHKALVLQPFTAPPSELPQPEYALLSGADLLYYASR